MMMVSRLLLGMHPNHVISQIDHHGALGWNARELGLMAAWDPPTSRVSMRSSVHVCSDFPPVGKKLYMMSMLVINVALMWLGNHTHLVCLCLVSDLKKHSYGSHSPVESHRLIHGDSYCKVMLNCRVTMKIHCKYPPVMTNSLLLKMAIYSGFSH